MPRLDLASFNLNLLTALDALLQERSVSRAAKIASVTPSAMSHSLAELRERLGDPLLVRVGRGMVLSPRAETLAPRLRRALLDVQRVVAGETEFDPRAAERHFVIAAPDFLATLLLPKILRVVRADAPRVTLEIVPSARRGNAWMLETGELDLALGAVVEDAPGIQRMDLCTEGFACAAREGHPEVDGSLDLETYARLPHLLITLGDDTRPTWIDRALKKLGRKRTVAARVRYFMAAPLVVARSDLLLTGPRMLLRYFAKLVPLQVLEPPIPLPTYAEEAFWHARFEHEPGHRWLRDVVRRAARALGTKTKPTRRAWDEDDVET